VIRLEDVFLELAGRPVLKGISFSLYPGDRLVILGESGIGKSTILRIILGLWEPDSGRVLVDGKDLRRMSETELRAHCGRLAMVFQGGALFDSLTVGENVGYRLLEQGRLGREAVAEVVREKLAAVGMEEAIDLYPAQLSGGMRKRAAIARALATEPECILFDEPTAGLDPVAAYRVDELIVRCQAHGKTTLVVTHDLKCAWRVGRRFMLIDEGRIVFEGSREEFERSAEPALRRFLYPEQSDARSI